MLKFEWNKLMRQRVLMILVTLVLTAYYIMMAFYGSFNTYSSGALRSFWDNEAYQANMTGQETRVVDEAWIAELERDYKAFVDENMLPEEKVPQYLEELKARGLILDFTAEEALNDRYNIDYAITLLPEDIYQSRLMEYRYFKGFRTYTPLGSDPLGYINNKYEQANENNLSYMGITWAQERGYTEAQMSDCFKTVDRRFADFQLVVGYCFGWDVLCGVMQYLPFSLGIALIVVLGNLFAQEKTHSMTPILRTTKHGRNKLLRTKLATAMTVSAVLWIFFQGAMLIAVAMSYGLDGATCTAMQYREPNPYALNWLEFYLVQCGFSFFGTQVFALAVCCVSSLLKPRLSMPVNLVLTLLTGQDMAQFCFVDQALQGMEKVIMLTPAQLLASYPVVQVYQSYEFGPLIIQLPYMMAIAIVVEAVGMIWFLHRREGGK